MKPATNMLPTQLHFAIVRLQLAPTAGPVTPLTELSMVKAAVLYADRVTLLSPQYSRSSGHLLMARRSRRYSEAHPEGLSDGPVDIGRSVRAHADWTERWCAENGTAELMRAEEAGLFEVVEVPTSKPWAVRRGLVPMPDPSPYTLAVSRHMGEITAPGSRSFPMLDGLASWRLGRMVTAGHLRDQDSTHSAQAALAMMSLGSLEAFPHASIDDLVGARADLTPQLVRFRAAVAEATEDVDSATDEVEFLGRVEDAYRLKVMPALVDLNEKGAELGAWQTLRRLSESPAVMASTGTALALGAGFAGAVHEVQAALAALAPAGASAAIVSEMNKRRTRRHELRSQPFAYLSELDRRLR